MSNLDTALSLARAGFYVFPLTATGKFLRGFSWDTGASRSAKQVRAWWADNPRQRIGITAGGAASSPWTLTGITGRTVSRA